ncbi:MAG TPA: hypothetical protein PLU22_21655, partial [Polyangiaceae bacterium]|nr:hypothetical protein [Polyangiaceae bacterium]
GAGPRGSPGSFPHRTGAWAPGRSMPAPPCAAETRRLDSAATIRWIPRGPPESGVRFFLLMSIAHTHLPGLDRERLLAAVEPVLAAHGVDGVELRWRTDRGERVLELTLERPGVAEPGGGITIGGRLYGAYDESVGNLIIRHVRVRPTYDGSDGEQFDGIQLSLNHDFILDHVSVSFAVDETVDLYEARDATVQWSVIESSATEGHPEGEQNYGLINGPDGVRLSVHHNLFAHHCSRCPAIANGPAEVRNNVAYNTRTAFVHNNPASGPFNLVGNHFRTGSSDTLVPFYFDDENDPPAGDLGYFLSGNVLDGTNSDCPPGSVDDPWTQCDYDPYRDTSFVVDEEFDFSGASASWRPVVTTTADEALEAVLAGAGAFPRDEVTLRSVQETQDGTGDWGARIPADLFAGLTAGTTPPDADDDGMADEWERAHGLDPADGDDHATVMASGYTAIEEYVNGLADALLQ